MMTEEAKTILKIIGAVMVLLGIRNVISKKKTQKEKEKEYLDKMFEGLREKGVTIDYDEDLLEGLEFDEDEELEE